MSANFLVDFYRLDTAKIGKPFDVMIQEVINLPDDQRTHISPNQLSIHPPIRLHHAEINQDYWHGDMVRIRMVETPVKASISGKLEDITLNDDEGLGERTAFIYHCPTQVLLINNTRSGVSISSFLNYFGKILGMSQEIYADPVLKPDAMVRLQKLSVLQKFEVRVAGLTPGNMSTFGRI